MSKLLEHLIEVKNLSGAIPVAPRGLRELKSLIDGIPLDISVPSIASAFGMGSMVSGIVDAIQDLGSLEAFGDLGRILGKVKGELGDIDILDIATLDKGRLEAALRSVVSENELVQAVGGVTAMLSGMMGGKK